MISLFKVCMSDEAEKEVCKVLRSGYIAQGQQNKRFEQLLAEKFCLSETNMCTTNSCTSALHLSFHLLKKIKVFKNEDIRVVASPLTCAAGIWPIIANDYPIVWCDIDHETMNIDLNCLKLCLDKTTRIVTFVHWGGNPVNYSDLADIQDWYYHKYGEQLYIVEDCAHAWGSTYNGQRLGIQLENSYACYSFQAIKNLTTGDGGLLIPPLFDVDRARKLRWFGLDRDNNQDFRSAQNIEEWGFKFHMNDIASTLGIFNLPTAEQAVQKQQDNAKYLTNNIDNPYVLTPTHLSEANPSYWLYSVRVKNKQKFVEYMKGRGIECNQVHTRVDNHKTVKHKGVYIDSMFGTRIVENEMVCIPCGWWLTFSELEHVVTTVNRYSP